MKYLAFLEYDWKDIEKVGGAWKKILDDREEGSDKWPKRIIDTYRLEADLPKLTKEVQGFTIFETEKEEHIINEVYQFAPFIKFKFIPIVDSRKAYQLYMGWKK